MLNWHTLGTHNSIRLRLERRTNFTHSLRWPHSKNLQLLEMYLEAMPCVLDNEKRHWTLQRTPAQPFRRIDVEDGQRMALPGAGGTVQDNNQIWKQPPKEYDGTVHAWKTGKTRPGCTCTLIISLKSVRANCSKWLCVFLFVDHIVAMWQLFTPLDQRSQIIWTTVPQREFILEIFSCERNVVKTYIFTKWFTIDYCWLSQRKLLFDSAIVRSHHTFEEW